MRRRWSALNVPTSRRCSSRLSLSGLHPLSKSWLVRPQAKVSSPGNGLGAVSHVQDAKQRVEVDFYRAFGEIQVTTDLLRRPAGKEAMENIPLPRRERSQGGISSRRRNGRSRDGLAPMWCGGIQSGDRGWDVDAAVQDLADRSNDGVGWKTFWNKARSAKFECREDVLSILETRNDNKRQHRIEMPEGQQRVAGLHARHLPVESGQCQVGVFRNKVERRIERIPPPRRVRLRSRQAVRTADHGETDRDRRQQKNAGSGAVLPG